MTSRAVSPSGMASPFLKRRRGPALSRTFWKILPAGGKLVATDLNEAMVTFARQKLGSEAAVEWKVADAMALPFEDEFFDAVVCQFGLMFVPEKDVAAREAHRVLKLGGKFVFNVWDGLEKNDFSRVAHQTIMSFFEKDPPRFFADYPYGFHDETKIRQFLERAEFQDIKMTPIELASVSETALDAARGLVQGTPVMMAVKERDATQIQPLTEAVAVALTRECGGKPCRGKMRALVWEATR